MILVTGGTGLVGSHLLYHLLLQHDNVRAINLRTSDLNAVKRVFSYYSSDYETLFQRVRWVEANLNDISSLEHAFEGVSQVYHCAALVSFANSDYQKMRRVNIEGTTNIVNLSIAHKIEKLCFVSSVAAIENGSANELIDENDNWNNNSEKSGYAITKYGAEMEVWRASQEGVPVVIVNPGVIMGSGFWHKGTGNLFSRIDRGLKFYSEGVTGFVDVKDVVRVMIKLMQSEVSNERFILISENLSYKKVLFEIADALNKAKPRIRVSRAMAELIWRFEYLRSKITLAPPLLTKHTARSSTSVRAYSSKKIRDLMGYEFERLENSIPAIAGDYKGELS